MTIGQDIANRYSADDSDGSVSRDIDMAIVSAIAAEREACARLADDHPHVAQAIRDQTSLQPAQPLHSPDGPPRPSKPLDHNPVA